MILELMVILQSSIVFYFGIVVYMWFEAEDLSEF